LAYALDPAQPVFPSPIIPLLVGDELEAVKMAAALREKGVFIPAIRYPTVKRGAARLRLTLSAAHTTADLDQLVAALKPFRFGFRISDFGSSHPCIL
jgi:7-keto-8-aminopelargonate synthetase-like enzyme